MNCCDDYGNCRQGRDCPIRITRALKERDLFWDVIEGLVTLAVILGIIASVCMLLGYLWYRT